MFSKRKSYADRLNEQDGAHVDGASDELLPIMVSVVHVHVDPSLGG
jgi:hypothetical protein